MVKPAVTPGTPDDALFRAAYEAYDDAEYERCLSLLALMPAVGDENVAALLLRIRALLRSDASAAAADVSALAIERASSADEIVVAGALRGASLRVPNSVSQIGNVRLKFCVAISSGSWCAACRKRS